MIIKLSYTEKNDKLSFDLFSEQVKRYYAQEFKKYSKNCEVSNSLAINWAFEEVKNLNDAILNERDVFLSVDKMPRTLDKGKHWYSIYYIDAEYKVRKLWIPPLMDKNRDRYCSLYGFSSGAIGMSRAFDATDYIFRLLKRCGGSYGQFS